MAVVVVFGNAVKDSLSVEDFIKIRCSLDGSDAFYTWSGAIFAYMPNQAPKHILDFIGYNVARCENINGSWRLITRELSYYLDPKTKERLFNWTNPVTGDVVNVVHVSNDPVNGGMGSVGYTMLNSDKAVIASDIPLFYPNPLHANSTYERYGGLYPNYEAGEFFKFYFSMNDLKSSASAVTDVSISWTRLSQWMPWMTMGSTPGELFCSCIGARAADLSHLPQWLQDDVTTRLPLYLHAPRVYNPETPNETSQTVFMRGFGSFLAGEVFPLPAPDESL